MKKTCMDQPRCRCCYYYSANDMACNYLLLTGSRRGSSVENCQRHRIGHRPGWADRREWGLLPPDAEMLP